MTVLGVVGAGTMGAGIAQLGVEAGMETRLHDADPAALDRVDLDGLKICPDIDGLAGCDLIIEAIVEQADAKRELFARLRELGDAVLASNTSSIPIASLGDVVGMHFFNPPTKMRLLEVIPGHATELAVEVGKRMGKHVIVVKDGPGFLVNRCGRPFYTEALKLYQEQIATPEQIDRICRLGAGFRMGPFELMDLVGIDVGLAVAKSFMELSFGEPRWKPNPIQARMVERGLLGRKSGRGYYDYSVKPYRPKDPDLPDPSEVDLSGFVSCATQSLGDRGAVGYFHLPGSKLIEFTGERSADAERFATAHGLQHEWVGDAPGLVLGRILACLVNEAWFAVGEGVGSIEDIDVGLKLGLNHPKGPSEWEIGRETLDGIWEERREERYRPAPRWR